MAAHGLDGSPHISPWGGRCAARAERHQPPDRQVPGIDDPAGAAAQGRRGDPVVDRRAFISAVGAGLLTVRLGAEAQQPGRIYRLGMLFPTARPPDQRAAASSSLTALRELGYVEGQNL